MDHTERHPNLLKMSEADFPLEEPWQDIRGLDVYDVNDEQIGSVEDLYVDRDSRLPRFLEVSAGGFLGIGKKHFLIPIEEVSRDMDEDRVTVNQPRDKVVESSDFDPDDVSNPDVQRAIHAYYGRT